MREAVTVRLPAYLLSLWASPIRKTLVKRIWIFLLIIACSLVIPLLACLRASWALLKNDIPRAWEIAQGYDRLGNAVANGASHEFMSTRANRAKQKGKLWGCYLCRFLDYLDKDHCAKSPETNEFSTYTPHE